MIWSDCKAGSAPTGYRPPSLSSASKTRRVTHGRGAALYGKHTSGRRYLVQQMSSRGSGATCLRYSDSPLGPDQAAAVSSSAASFGSPGARAFITIGAGLVQASPECTGS